MDILQLGCTFSKKSLICSCFRNLDQQLFNKANEIQEEISKKRFVLILKQLPCYGFQCCRYDLRCYQIRLSGIRAQVAQIVSKIPDCKYLLQKQLYDNTVKQEGDNLIAVQSGGAR